MQVFADDGARINVCVDGRERDVPVVLIHGFPLTRAIWDVQADSLAKRFCVIRPDLRGAGASSAPDGPYLMERLASDVAAVLDALAIERVALAGHSMGGYLALAFARMFTERVTHLALVASRLRADTPDEAAGRRALADRLEREMTVEPVVEAYLPRLLSPKTVREKPQIAERAYEIARKNTATGAAATLRGIALRASSEDIAEDLDVPALVLAGGLDRVVPLEEARSVAAKFPRAELVICDESGHLPMMEEPPRVTDALARWLSA
jgi:pimeloyl-ACP methyl ester carboxylesterase